MKTYNEIIKKLEIEKEANDLKIYELENRIKVLNSNTVGEKITDAMSTGILSINFLVFIEIIIFLVFSFSLPIYLVQAINILVPALTSTLYIKNSKKHKYKKEKLKDITNKTSEKDLKEEILRNEIELSKLKSINECLNTTLSELKKDNKKPLTNDLIYSKKNSEEINALIESIKTEIKKMNGLSTKIELLKKYNKWNGKDKLDASLVYLFTFMISFVVPLFYCNIIPLINMEQINIIIPAINFSLSVLGAIKYRNDTNKVFNKINSERLNKDIDKKSLYKYEQEKTNSIIKIKSMLINLGLDLKELDKKKDLLKQYIDNEIDYVIDKNNEDAVYYDRTDESKEKEDLENYKKFVFYILDKENKKKNYTNDNEESIYDKGPKLKKNNSNNYMPGPK